jgi:predicted ribosome quality control (RQC) complex YloA/Tae2 family protein
MALDGAFLACLRQEPWDSLPDARVDKIHQPSREELVLLLRYRGGDQRLYFSARAHSPRVHFTENVPENPASPPMFCMLLRKRLSGGRLVAIRQNGWERALYFDFDCVNELGDIVRLTLAVEIMGRHSNIILIDENVFGKYSAPVRDYLPYLGHVIRKGKILLHVVLGSYIKSYRVK